MGNWNINIQGIGCHHNGQNPTDADLMAADFVTKLREAGHLVEGAIFTHGAKEDIIDGRNVHQRSRVSGGCGLGAAVAALLMLLFCWSAGAAEKSWWTDVSVTPFAAINRPNLTDAPRYGAGLDLGYAVNHTVSLHVANLAYAQDHWRGPTIDQTSLLGEAALIRYSQERLVLSILASGDRQWERDDWGFGAGAKLELRLSKYFSIGADGRLVAFFKDKNALQLRGFIRGNF